MGQSVIGAGDRAFPEVETETKRREQAQLPAHIERGPDVRLFELVEQERGRLIEIGARRIALVEAGAQKRRDGGDRREGIGIIKEARGPLSPRLGDIEPAELLVQPAGP